MSVIQKPKTGKPNSKNCCEYVAYLGKAIQVKLDEFEHPPMLMEMNGRYFTTPSMLKNARYIVEVGENILIAKRKNTHHGKPMEYQLHNVIAGDFWDMKNSIVITEVDKESFIVYCKKIGCTMKK